MTARKILTALAFLAVVTGAAAALVPPALAERDGMGARVPPPDGGIDRAFSLFGDRSPDADADEDRGSDKAARGADGDSGARPSAGGVPVPAGHPMSRGARAAADERRQASMRAIAAGGVGLEAMIGQMLMVGFDGDDLSDPGPQRILRHIRAGRLGGVILFKRNVKSAAAVKEMTAAFRAASPGLPLLVAVDQEGGRVQRLTRAVGFPETPSAVRVASRGDEAARSAYQRMAQGLAAFGFNVNLAPVVDLAVRDDNPIITRIGRAYSADPVRVTRLASAFVDAHRAAGVVTSLKHFPGHGSSSGDTHHGFVDVSGSWTDRELEPYRAMIGAGRADMVMVAHVHHRDFSPPGRRDPATLSPKVIEGLLRRDLGFDGVVISDDMEMGAISALGAPVDIAARAILAGNDILIYAGGAAPGMDLVAVLQARLAEAARRDPRVAERIRESHARIVRLKRERLR